MHPTVLLAGLVAAALVAPAARAAEGDEAAAQREAMLTDCGYAELPVKAYPGASGVLSCARQALERVEVPLGRTYEGDMKLARVEGEATRFNFPWPRGTSFLDVSRHYEGVLREAGFQLLYPARGADLGFVSARREDTWVVVEPYGGGSQVTVVKARPLEQAATADAAGMLEALEQRGRVAVDGITFAAGKATLTPEAEEALSEVRKLLQGERGLRLRIECHGDDTAKPRASLELARKRAAAVKAWLTRQGIAPARLQSEGHGGTGAGADGGPGERQGGSSRVELVKL